MSKTKELRTSTGEIVSGEKLRKAFSEVADDLVKLAHKIRSEDEYASHVSEARKDLILADGLAFAEGVRAMRQCGFTIWQRVNQKLTGECVAFLK